MKIADLGRLTGPVLVWGGAYGNFAALGALLRDATRQGLPPERVISAGHVAGMCAGSADCIAAWRAFGGPGVAGGIERALAAGASDPGLGDAPGGARAMATKTWWPQLARQIAAPARDWIEDLPDMVVFAHEGRRWAVVHAAPGDPGRPLWPGAPETDFARAITACAAAAGPLDGLIVGHSGLAFERDVDGIAWIDAGAIGLPPHDTRRMGRYIRLDTDGARILRLDYDPAPTFAAMVASGLTQGWDLALMDGRWPGAEGLPDEMRE